MKIFFKGVPTFEHPQGTDVDFGFGITGKKLCYWIMLLSQPFHSVLALLDNIFGLKSPAKQSGSGSGNGSSNYRDEKDPLIKKEK